HTISNRDWSSDVCSSDLAGLVLAELARRGELASGVRLIFQPAEEVQPGGALHLLDTGVLEDIDRIFAVHCDPKVQVGRIGTRIEIGRESCRERMNAQSAA